MEHESIDDRARRAVTQLRRDVTMRSLPELKLRSRRWVTPLVAVATVIIVIVGLFVIGTNRNDQSVGNELDRFRWIVTDLPAGWRAQYALDPFNPGDRRPPRRSPWLGCGSERLAQSEQMFGTALMLTVHDVESIRRSAAMAPLSSNEAFRVLDACDELLRERVRIAAALADLPASWSQVRKVLNELQAIVA